MRPPFFIVVDIVVVIIVMMFIAVAAQGRHHPAQMIIVQAEDLESPSTYIDLIRRYSSREHIVIEIYDT